MIELDCTLYVQQNVAMFVLGKPFQPSLMIVGKARGGFVVQLSAT